MTGDLSAYPRLLLTAAERLDHEVESVLANVDRDGRLSVRLAAIHRVMAAAWSTDPLRIDASDSGTPSPETLHRDASRIIAEHHAQHAEDHPALAAWLDAWETYQVELTYAVMDLLGDVRTYGLATRLRTYQVSAEGSA